MELRIRRESGKPTGVTGTYKKPNDKYEYIDVNTIEDIFRIIEEAHDAVIIGSSHRIDIYDQYIE